MSADKGPLPLQGTVRLILEIAKIIYVFPFTDTQPAQTEKTQAHLSYCSFPFSFFLFHFAGWSGIVLCCPMRKEVGVRKCLFFWDQQELASSQAVPFFAAGTMHWRHTP